MATATWTGVGLDIITNLANQTANRALATTYQNTTNSFMIVDVTLTAGGSAALANISVGASPSTLTIIFQQTISASNSNGFQVDVPHGWYYQVTANATPTVTYWYEKY
jgi:hypothetical protein